MAETTTNQDRMAAAMLLAFVPLQLAYLFIEIFVMSPPAPDAPIAELRALAVEQAAMLRWHSLIPLFTFVGLLMPASVGLHRRLTGSSPANLWPDVMMVGALLTTVSVFITLLSLAVLGLMPAAELSDSVLRAMIMVDVYGAWVVGSFSLALFAGAASAALLHLDRAPRWLARMGLAVSAFGVLGALWLVRGEFEGALFGLNMLSRAVFFAWLVAVAWWLRQQRSDTSAAA